MAKIRITIEERTGKRVLLVAPYIQEGTKMYAVYFADGTDADYDCDSGEIRFI